MPPRSPLTAFFRVSGRHGAETRAGWRKNWRVGPAGGQGCPPKRGMDAATGRRATGRAGDANRQKSEGGTSRTAGRAGAATALQCEPPRRIG